MNFGWLKTRQTKSGAYMAVYVIVMIAILAAANYLATQYNKTYDATKSKLFSLSDQTLKVLSNLESDVKIYYFDRKTEFSRAKDTLVRYENAASRVSVDYVDPDARPELAKAMNVRTYGTVMIEMAGNREEAKSLQEEEITNAIIRSVKGEEKTACLLAGHGEADPDGQDRDGFAVAKEEIEGVNYTTKTISLLENPEIPQDCTLVIVAGPKTAYLEPEIDILRKHIEGGGRALFMIDHKESPELAALLASWGVNVNDDVVVDMTGIGQLFGSGPLTPLVAGYKPHPISDVMGNVATFFPMTRSVEKGDAPPNWSVSELFSTTSGSFATAELEVVEGELRRHPEKEREGPINLAVAATYDVPRAGGDAVPKREADAGEGETEDTAEEMAPDAADAEKAQGRVVVTGTSLFARNNFLQRGGNLDLFLNMLNWLSSDEDLISIRPKEPENTPLDISESEMKRLFWGTVIGLPLVIVITGIRVWWLRRA